MRTIAETKLREFLIYKAKHCKSLKEQDFIRFYWYNNWIDDRYIEFCFPIDLE